MAPPFPAQPNRHRERTREGGLDKAGIHGFCISGFWLSPIWLALTSPSFSTAAAATAAASCCNLYEVGSPGRPHMYRGTSHRRQLALVAAAAAAAVAAAAWLVQHAMLDRRRSPPPARRGYPPEGGLVPLACAWTRTHVASKRPGLPAWDVLTYTAHASRQVRKREAGRSARATILCPSGPVVPYVGGGARAAAMSTEQPRRRPPAVCICEQMGGRGWLPVCRR